MFSKLEFLLLPLLFNRIFIIFWQLHLDVKEKLIRQICVGFLNDIFVGICLFLFCYIPNKLLKRLILIFSFLMILANSVHVFFSGRNFSPKDLSYIKDIGSLQDSIFFEIKNNFFFITIFVLLFVVLFTKLFKKIESISFKTNRKNFLTLMCSYALFEIIKFTIKV